MPAWPLSVYAFGTGGKRKRIFQDIYFSVEETNGVGVLYTKTGEYLYILSCTLISYQLSLNVLN